MKTGLVHRDVRYLPLRLTLVLGLPLVLLAGCAGLPEQPQISDQEVAWAAGGAGGLPAQGGAKLEDASSLLHVTDEMRRFARSATGGRMGVDARTNALVEALASPQGLHMQYDAQASLTAQQAFEQHRANCLAYTFLFVALAREVGIPVKFNDVDIPPLWDMGDEKTSLLYRHINARVELPSAFYTVVDVGGDEFDTTYAQFLVPDEEAEAQFYNNRAVELRLQKRLDDALRYEVRALELAPNADYLWVNLSSLYLLEGNPRAARIAVTQALKLNSSSMLGYDTASQVYEKLGNHQLAQYFTERARYFIEQNPYYHYQLAVAALNQKDDETAFQEARRAIMLYPKDSRFFFLIAVVLNDQGNDKLAGASMKAALALAPNEAQQERYKSKFARLVAIRG